MILFYLRLLLLLLERIFPSGPRSVAAIIKVIINDRYLHVFRLHGARALHFATASVSSVGAKLLLPPPLPPPPRVAHTGTARHRRKTGRRAGGCLRAQVEDHLLLLLVSAPARSDADYTAAAAPLRPAWFDVPARPEKAGLRESWQSAEQIYQAGQVRRETGEGLTADTEIRRARSVGSLTGISSRCVPPT